MQIVIADNPLFSVVHGSGQCLDDASPDRIDDRREYDRDARHRLRIQEYARVRARESKVSPEMVSPPR